MDCSQRVVLLATVKQFHCPPVGKTYFPLTVIGWLTRAARWRSR